MKVPFRPATGTLRSCFPDELQHRLLTVCLAPSPQVAIAAWTAWISAVGIDTLDQASSRLLPLAYHRLAALGVRHPEMPRLAGVLRHAWANNLTQRHQVDSVLRTLTSAGITHLLLKGAPLAFSIYPNPGARPMDDIDVLVPLDRATEAIELLLRDGATLLEQPLPPRRPGADVIDPLLLKHGLSFRSAQGLNLDLHWFALQDCRQPGIDDGFWARRRPLAAIPGASRAGPEDNLLHLCVHGLRASPVASIRWIADAVLLLRATGDDFDWGLLRAEARRRRLVVPLFHALSYLRANFEQRIPDEVLAHFAAEPTSLLERAAHHGNVSASFFTQFAATWMRYRRTMADRSWLTRCRGFPPYLIQCWGCLTYGDVFRHIVGRTLRSGKT